MFRFRLPFTTDNRKLVDADMFEDVIRDEYDRILQEQTTQADRELAAEDVDWMRLGQLDGRVMTEKSRRDIVKLSRIFSIRNAIARQSVQLYTNFSIGTGMSISANDQRVKSVLQEFWRSKANKRFTNTKGQRRLSDMFLTDGELFFALFIKKGRIPVVRPLEALEIIDIATDPDDKYTPRFYKRSRVVKNNKIDDTWLQDFENNPRRPGRASNGDMISAATRSSLPLVYYVQLQGCDTRGYPLATAQIQWARAHKVFMNSRMAIQQALARVAKQYRTKGGLKQVNAIKAALRSGFVSGSTETNPPPSYASSEVMNTAMDVKTVRQETGARAAEIDGNMILTMAGAAVGVFPHYFGAGEAFRLATATAMETPMLKTFQAYREIWLDLWRDIFDFVLEAEGISVEEGTYFVTYPDIFPEKLQSHMQAIDFALKGFPELRQLDEIKKLVLTRLGMTGVDALVDSLEDVSHDENNNEEVQDAAETLHKLLRAVKNGN